MAILAECQRCHRKQAVKNKVCKCGNDLDRAKKARRVKYWLAFRYTDPKTGKVKQRKESLAKFKDLDSTSITDARKAHDKRSTQVAEHRMMDVLPQATMSFNELAGWYLNLPSIKKLASYPREVSCLNQFNKEFGSKVVGMIKLEELESYQEQKERQGLSAATIDLHISTARKMVKRAWDHEMVDGRVGEIFKRVKNKLTVGANARDRVLAPEEYLPLVAAAADHLKPIIITAYHTGMRRGELLGLEWSHIDHPAGMIRLPTSLTKTKRVRSIPINQHVKRELDSLRLSRRRNLGHDFVFTFNRKPIRDIKTAFVTACEGANIIYGQGIPGGLRFHDLRASFKTHLFKAGVGRTARDVLLGHTLRGMDKFYLRVSDEDLKSAMDKYTVWIDSELADVHHLVAQEAI